MSILTANNLSLSYGAFDVFRGLSASVPNNGKIGLIGPNGIGKTSLLLILAGLNPPTTGEIHLARGRRLGYLRQEAVDAFADRQNSVFAEMLSVFDGLQAQQARLNQLETQMAAGDFDADLLETYGTLQQAFEHAGGYDYELRIQQTLQGLGLGKDDWETPINHLSGGQKTRALLARLLLEQPDLLMLDEPTNHLDLQAVEWLERTLREWSGAVLIVSHDRYFLDNVVNTIWEMDRTSLTAYSGTYSAYLLQRQERWDYLERVFTEEKARLQKEVDFIQRNWVRASTHARALGLLRRLSRDLAIVEAYGVMGLRTMKWHETGLSVERPLDVIEAVRQVNAIAMPSNRPPHLKPRFNTVDRGGNIVLHADHAEIGYPGNHLFTIRNLELRRGQCAALVGPNGSGKTTFLKVLLGQLPALQGEVRLGGGLHINYFAQAHDSLSVEGCVLDELLRHKPSLDPGPARSHLAQYLFRGEDVFKPVATLSGGERARLALAILALEGSNLLLLDEPTNHLDIPAREALQEVLENYPGTILLVSHDRYLVDRLATQIWDIRAGQLVVFRGTYREYLLRGSAARPLANGIGKSPSKAAPSAMLVAAKPLPRDNSRDTRRRQEQIARLEASIREHETRLQRLSAELEKAGQKQSFEAVHDLSWQAAQAEARLDELMAEWEQLAL